MQPQVTPGGGIVYFPAGTYLVSIRSALKGESPWPRAFTIYPNVTLQGAGSATSIIKLKANQAKYGALLMSATYGGDVSGFNMFDVTLDSNALNNPLYSNSDNNQTDWDLERPRISVWIAEDSGVKIQRCVFTNIVAVSCLDFYSYDVSNFLIDSNSFTNIGGGSFNFRLISYTFCWKRRNHYK
jgi:Pectate lyase superfamily protein